MRKFNDLLKFTWKRFSVWILLVTIFCTMAVGILVQNNIKNDYERFTNCVSDMRENLYGGKHNEDIEINEESIDKIKIEALKLKGKYKLCDDDDVFSMDVDGKAQDDYFERLSKNGGYDAHYIYNNIRSFLEKFDDGKFNGSGYYEALVFPIVIFIGLFALSITSLEQSLAIYDFTRLMPWKKKDELIMKIGIVFLFGMVIFAINALVLAFILKASAFGKVVSFALIAGQILRNILIFLGASIISTSLGFICGNFLGHLGLYIMTLAGFELYRVNLNMTLNAFSFDFAERVEDLIRSFEGRLNPFFKTLMSLSYMRVDSLITILAFLIVALVIFILALYLSKNQSSERSGYMIANKKLGVFCKLMASLTLANLMTSILASVFVQKISPVIVIIFILALLISYKFFDMLFKIRLKF
ncbi:hypothetical protein [Anaerococcus tetradius]|uniref:hypothetical protein n=1 Tax=Anaerococcus tetradius TaxID=33036 RepID=UPI0023F1D00A|nr:hypothetical protein [Anaerococcus tetradius]